MRSPWLSSNCCSEESCSRLKALRLGMPSSIYFASRSRMKMPRKSKFRWTSRQSKTFWNPPWFQSCPPWTFLTLPGRGARTWSHSASTSTCSKLWRATNSLWWRCTNSISKPFGGDATTIAMACSISTSSTRYFTASKCRRKPSHNKLRWTTTKMMNQALKTNLLIVICRWKPRPLCRMSNLNMKILIAVPVRSKCILPTATTSPTICHRSKRSIQWMI